MTLATMTDRSKPLADRVQAATFLVMKAAVGMSEGTWTKGQNDEADSAMTELLADIAAADRLARAAETLDRTTRAPMGSRLIGKLPAAIVDRREALEAYRARMAQGVGDARP